MPAESKMYVGVSVSEFGGPAMVWQSRRLSLEEAVPVEFITMFIIRACCTVSRINVFLPNTKVL